MSSVLLLLLAAAGVGIAHSILPDHWVPLAVIARANRWSLGRTAKVSLLAGIGHVAVSLVLGVLLVAVGLALRQAIVAEEGRIVGAVLVVTGLGFLAWAAATRGKGHGHSHAHPHVHEHDHEGAHEPSPGDAAHTHADPAHSHTHPYVHGVDDPHPEPSPGRAAVGTVHSHPHPHDAGPARRRGGWLAEIAVPFGVAASPDLTILPVFLAASAVGVAAAVGALATFAAATLATFVGLTVVATAGGYQVHWPWLDENGHLVSALVLLVVGILVFLQV